MVIVILCILGLAFGSFVNALVWRLHQQSLPKKKRAADDSELSISKGRSMCPHCKHALAWYDLVPVLSWLSLGGRCRYCRRPISGQYPLVELLTAGLFVGSYVFWPQDLNSYTLVGVFSLWLAALVCLMALIVYDIRWMLLPNKIVFPLIGMGVLMTLIRALGSSNIVGALLAAIGGLAVAGGIFYVVFQISNGTWIGGGDVKLGFAIGLFLGSPVLAFLMLFLASVLGLVVALPGVVSGRRALAAQLPFGPFLITSTIVVMLFGQHLIDWYVSGVLYL